MLPQRSIKIIRTKKQERPNEITYLVRQGFKTKFPKCRSFCSAAAKVGPSSSVTSLVVMGLICDKPGLSPFSKLLILSGLYADECQNLQARN